MYPQKGNFDLGFYPTVSDCTVSAFRLCMYNTYNSYFFYVSSLYIERIA